MRQFLLINQSHRSVTSQSITAIAALILTLWLSFAFIDHQFDTIAEHHNHHDCQLFSNIQCGLKSIVMEIIPVIAHGFVAPNAEPIKISRPTYAYLARSPPITVLSMKS
jgi:hypothetical protein